MVVRQRPFPSSLPLPTFKGEVKEDVYFAQLQLQDSLKELLESLDRAQGAATGTLKKVGGGERENILQAMMLHWPEDGRSLMR